LASEVGLPENGNPGCFFLTIFFDRFDFEELTDEKLLLLLLGFCTRTDQLSEPNPPLETDLIKHLRIFFIVLFMVVAGLWLLRALTSWVSSRDLLRLPWCDFLPIVLLLRADFCIVVVFYEPLKEPNCWCGRGGNY